MASTYTGLGTELMVTGEAAGTWGTKTNTNLQILEQISGGYVSIALNTTGATTLAVSDGAATDANQVAHRCMTFTAALGGNVTVTIPLDGQQLYVIKNSTTEDYSVEFKYVSGSGGSVTWASGDRGTKIVYATANDGTNPDIIDATTDYVTATSTTTFTNKTLTSPKTVTSILDTNGLELALITATGSAVNEFTIANAAAGAGPTLSATGDESNVDINLNPKGSGVLKSGTAAVKVAGTETIWVPATAMYPSVTSGSPDAATIEITADANRPIIKAIAFDKDSDEYAQFSIAFPKSWNEGTITFQPFFTANSTNGGTALFMLKGITISDNDAISQDFGTAQGTAKAHSGTAYDLDVGAESSAITIAGSPAVGDETFFAIFRDVSGDTLTADALLTGIKIFYTTDAANDA